ncbi:hypothetical protein [Cellulomonas dongxiuzhuiae]|uniref:hypothetical protein n=1 Tax=Cellulomonas dongxiuzhuiae TaxID=2819979 RepID=UPI001AAF722A|nr:hypothetical protein [Cellulomonas dongxiuzhuiae]MBO3089572.1 hypothetical protein [Cellulomonas dongxiuzhuiae]
MLEQPWPPPGAGPRQPRDAHGLQWANDVRRALVRPAPSSGSDPWADVTGRQPAARRRGAEEQGRHEGPERAGRDHGDPEDHASAPRDAGGRGARPLPARWVPQEAWIPDPAPAPEQRWTPEQDWLNAFAARREAASQEPAVSPAARRWWVLAGVAVPSLGSVVALVVALV